VLGVVSCVRGELVRLERIEFLLFLGLCLRSVWSLPVLLHRQVSLASVVHGSHTDRPLTHWEVRLGEIEIVLLHRIHTIMELSGWIVSLQVASTFVEFWAELVHGLAVGDVKVDGLLTFGKINSEVLRKRSAVTSLLRWVRMQVVQNWLHFTTSKWRKQRCRGTDIEIHECFPFLVGLSISHGSFSAFFNVELVVNVLIKTLRGLILSWTFAWHEVLGLFNQTGLEWCTVRRWIVKVIRLRLRMLSLNRYHFSIDLLLTCFRVTVEISAHCRSASLVPRCMLLKLLFVSIWEFLLDIFLFDRSGIFLLLVMS